jgi:hypothetical protein
MRAWFYSVVEDYDYSLIPQIGREIHYWFKEREIVADESDGTPSCAIVRDPVDRAISYFMDKGWRSFNQIDEYVEWLESNWIHLSTPNVDEHIKPQHYFVPPSSEIVQIEEFRERIEDLEKLYGIEMFEPINRKARPFTPSIITPKIIHRIAMVYLVDLARFYPEKVEEYLTH